MNIEIKEDIIPELELLISLYNNVGWTNYTSNPKMLENAYKNSLKIISAWHDEKLVGVIRVVGDGYSIIYIQDLLVLTEYQRNRIGYRLLSAVFEKFDNVYQNVLLTDNMEDKKAFYEKCGFNNSEKYGCVSFVKFN
ncbi:GNAT family N-acetyltransferase [Sedimentibacter sp. zth1]|uniref:GNAT family N-acetyltransferase n=1 Tax=Sedimentibacter sp. zth1 TaxID=2816908 RepID=UPI001A9309AE|nr:GNAT family N-acetyltransferase [Sedimentibacter sp. zth1]QSX06643.1 GNAT family N-acetyltransferase [Sedimentibacter sp. zth1]